MPNTVPDTQALHVAVGVVIRNGRCLIAKRPKHIHQGGKWEFPGGKVEPGESVIQALCREFEEELGIRPTRFEPLIKTRHAYKERQVLLDVWRILEFDGEPRGCEGQLIKWVPGDQLRAFSFPSANLPILDAISTPSR